MNQHFTQDELYTLLDAIAHAIRNSREVGIPEAEKYRLAYEKLDRKVRTYLK